MKTLLVISVLLAFTLLGMPKYGKCLKVMKRGGQVLKILPVPRERQLKSIKVQKEVLSAESWRETAVFCCLSKDPGSLTVFG